jgi:hypothetical protein
MTMLGEQYLAFIKSFEAYEKIAASSAFIGKRKCFWVWAAG